MPYFVSKEVEFDAGHRVPNHASKCRNPHGHRYKVRATFTGALVNRSGASDEGMVIDFGDISTMLQEHVHDVYDHGFIVYENDLLKEALLNFGEESETRYKIVVVDWIPTAENMAKEIFEDLYPEVTELYGEQVSLYRIDVHETPKSVATYSLGGLDV
jgi:6-pyruvoyltetrahydropterin/6-carboxytetrahydropterin synthase